MIKFARVMNYSVLVGCSLLVLFGVNARAGSYQRTRDGNALIWNENPKPGVAAGWSGRRDKEGYASGYGTLTWFTLAKTVETGSRIPSTRRYEIVARYSGNMVRGKFVGSKSNNAPATAPAQRRNAAKKGAPV